ncbi:uncharacterized protein LOC135829796 [Sycon ciliatum]|uniref:uncharacterized protein LOC135829796 n=1 Tax=Sycon ciliatum TaxID=27933 RepID=UPI0020AD48AE|eukprot:scpid55153/ scgid27650/ Collagen alpha-5(VI) chain; Collagen alpha-1(XXIX) chain
MATSGFTTMLLVSLLMAVASALPTSQSTITERLFETDRTAIPSTTQDSLASQSTAVESAATTDDVVQDTSHSTSAPDVPATTEMSLERRCEDALLPWTPWTTKAENIVSDHCGVRRRNRRFRKTIDANLERSCVDTLEIELTEYKEECKVLSRNENVEVIQYYFVNEVFGNNRLALEEELSGGRKKRFLDFDPLEPINPDIFGPCFWDMTHRPVDFLIMLDKSGSMIYKDFRLLLRAMKFLVEKGIPEVSQDATRVAMMTFANHPTTEFDFNTCNNKSCVVKQTYQSTFEGGLTRMAAALNHANSMFQESRGMRPCSRRVVLMLTDGSSSDYDNASPVEAADNLKQNKDVEIFVVGITTLINEMQLQSIVTYPVLTHLYYMPDVRQTRRVFKKIKEAKPTEV